MTERIYRLTTVSDEPLGISVNGGEEIVRCRDCRHYSEHGWVVAADVDNVCHFWHGEPTKVSPDGFCAWGERNDDSTPKNDVSAGSVDANDASALPISVSRFIETENETGERDSRDAANRPISESADRETPKTAEIGASKDEIRDFDVWSVAYEIYCAGGYVGNGNEPNPPTDGIRELLDRQAAITRAEFDKPGWEYCETCEEIARLRDVNERQDLEYIENKKRINELEKQNMNLAHDLGECMADRDRYRALCGQMLDAAHEIRRIADANMPEGGVAAMEPSQLPPDNRKYVGPSAQSAAQGICSSEGTLL